MTTFKKIEETQKQQKQKIKKKKKAQNQEVFWIVLSTELRAQLIVYTPKDSGN